MIENRSITDKQEKAYMNSAMMVSMGKDQHLGRDNHHKYSKKNGFKFISLNSHNYFKHTNTEILEDDDMMKTKQREAYQKRFRNLDASNPYDHQMNHSPVRQDNSSENSCMEEDSLASNHNDYQNVDSIGEMAKKLLKNHGYSKEREYGVKILHKGGGKMVSTAFNNGYN